MAVIRFGHLGICVSNMEKALEFYRDLLGFRPLTQTHVEGEEAAQLLRLPKVKQDIVFLERDNVRLALYAFEEPQVIRPSEPRAMNETGFAAMMLRVDDIDSTLDAMRSAGVRVLDETYSAHPDYGSKLVFLCDPDGTLIELIEIPGDPYVPFGTPVAT